jgi:hypothetical protein
VADSRRINLSDPAIPESRQPYHAGFASARDAGPDLDRLVASIKRFSRRSVLRVLRDYEQAGHRVCAVGVIVGSLADPDRISSDHIRIHALEGRLYRTVVEDAVTMSGIPRSTWRERDLYELAAETLSQPEPSLRGILTALGRDVSGPWRVEQKAAALAAWLLLA